MSDCICLFFVRSSSWFLKLFIVSLFCMFQFFLQDTKSSNGTFINNQRLSKGSEESQPRELFSGDVVQFGVDVLENARRGKTMSYKNYAQI